MNRISNNQSLTCISIRKARRLPNRLALNAEDSRESNVSFPITPRSQQLAAHDASLGEFDSRRLSLRSGTESKKRSMIKELRVDYRKCFNNSALLSTAKRFSPSTRQSNLTGLRRRRIQSNYSLNDQAHRRGPLVRE